MKCLLRTVAESVQAQLVGDGAVEVSGIASIAQATPLDLVFVEDERNLRLALESRAAAVIAGEFAMGEVAKMKTSAKRGAIKEDRCENGPKSLDFVILPAIS